MKRTTITEVHRKNFLIIIEILLTMPAMISHSAKNIVNE